MARLQGRAAILAVAAAWVGFLFYLGAIPSLPEGLSSTRLVVSTPLGHYGSHVMLGALLYLGFSTPLSGPSHCTRAAILAILGTVAIGAGIEGVQLFIPTRAAEAADIAANSLGGITGASIVFVPDRLNVSRVILSSATAGVAIGGILVVAVATIALKPGAPHVIDCEAQATESLSNDGETFGSIAPSGAVTVPGDEFSGPRVTDGLVLLYEFSEGSGNVVYDRSSVESSLDLLIPEDSEAQWLTDGNGIVFPGDGVIRSRWHPTKVYRALLTTNRLTVEGWVSPGDLDQTGPAKILSLAGKESSRQVNLWLGQDGPELSFGLRTICNALNVTSVPGVFTEMTQTHVTVTYDGSRARTFVNGVGIGDGEPLQGNLSNWDIRYLLTVANDLGASRPFVGTVSLIAIYDRSLSPEEVRLNYLAGP